ncbi:alpha/beta fold hydrolase [Sphingomonas sp.]|uniref:alpha/beta fold hydrolase n=1 Tax=Sphingomonas sp. TaxID=28214 RepID=UPI000DB41016|nr:alpha/beta hydrolase [Sphingomonas sp.]PZU09787.1 MAG: alpha/beta hydrolase [Sphingomonas sp.]
MSGYVDRFWQSSDGLRLHARDYAAAPGPARLPVFCLHGLTRNARDFGMLAPHLAGLGRRVLAIDVRGRGLSDWARPETYQLPFYAEDVARLAEALGIGAAIFIGTSMGGLITMELAGRSPALIRSAIINDVGPRLSDRGLARIAGYVGKSAPVATWGEAADHLRALNADALPHYGPEDWRLMAERMYREIGGRLLADYDPAIALPFTSKPLVTDPQQRWADLAGARPILLLRGDRSDLLDPDAAEEMVAGRPDATLASVANVGHAPMLDEPDALDAIGCFLDRQP